jgi:hypothetical protein
MRRAVKAITIRFSKAGGEYLISGREPFRLLKEFGNVL